jgi:chorismate dehydratase
MSLAPSDLAAPVPKLTGLRIGSVPYLNARPLHYGIEDEVQLMHPVMLARELREGRIDAALVPIVEVLENPIYDLVDGIGIASDGPVHSVVLCHRKPIDQIETVALDAASKTSAQLVRIVINDFLKRNAAFVPQGNAADAELWIGDQAIAYRREHPGESYLDLGGVWRERTGLPFIFAAWALRRSVPIRDPKGAVVNADTAAYLRRVAAAGLSARRSIAQNEDDYRYLTENIQYRIGPREHAGLSLFAALLAARGTIPAVPRLNWL